MINWLFLRGDWDCRTQKSIDDDDDMWLHLFSEMIGDEPGTVYFRSNKDRFIKKDNYVVISGDLESMYNRVNSYSHIFSRGGFNWQADIVKHAKHAYTIRYGAGRRYIPEADINYNLVLVDSERQKKHVRNLLPKCNVQYLIKPAAKHFKPIPCEKEYDVCFIAKDPQAHFKGVKWVYDTVRSNIQVLHLGSDGRHNPPGNVTCKIVDRIDMPKWISKCKVGIVPYFNDIDSCPRVIPEMLACGLTLLISNELHFWNEKYISPLFNSKKFGSMAMTSFKNTFWNHLQLCLERWEYENANEYYQNNLSISKAAEHIRSIIFE